MANSPDGFARLAEQVARATFFPSTEITIKRLAPLTWIVMAVVVVGTVALAEPHVRNFVTGLYGVKCLSLGSEERGRQYCDFAMIVSQTLIAVVIGGVVITDQIVRSTQNWISRFQTDRVKNQDANQLAKSQELQTAIQTAVGSIRDLGNDLSVRNFGSKVLTATRKIAAIYIITNSIPRFTAWLILLRFISAFPKGFYGLLAFVLFEAFLAEQVLTLYFEYLPVCHASLSTL